MGEIHRQANIEAPVAKVYGYVSNAHNAPHFISSIKRIVSGPEGVPAEGQVWRAEANFLGRPAMVNLRLSELRPDHLVRISLLGEPSATVILQLAPHNQDSTSVSLTLDVPSVPGILLNALMGGLLEGDLSRLKRVLEGET